MNPDQFEQAIASHYSAQGYKCDVQGGSYDYGVDIIAENEVDKLAIQVKMYDKRQVNYQAVMYLYAGQYYFDCNKSILITSGAVKQDAKNVAKRLGVEIIEYWMVPNQQEKKQELTISEEVVPSSIEGYPSFEEAWERYIVPLKGRTLYTATGRENRIINISFDGIKRESSTGRKSFINIEIFRQIYRIIIEQKSITRDEINHLYVGRASAFIVPLLAELPFIKMQLKPTKLILTR